MYIGARVEPSRLIGLGLLGYLINTLGCMVSSNNYQG
jgi:hypothetical protein